MQGQEHETLRSCFLSCCQPSNNQKNVELLAYCLEPMTSAFLASSFYASHRQILPLKERRTLIYNALLACLMGFKNITNTARIAVLPSY